MPAAQWVFTAACMWQQHRPFAGVTSTAAHQVSLRHADARVDDCEGVVGLVWNDVDVQLRVAFQDSLVGEGLEPAA